MVNGDSMHELLLQAVGTAAAEQESKRRNQPSRAGSIPPRGTTPSTNSNVSQGHAPPPPPATSSKKPGTVRPAPPGSQSAPNKRMKLMSEPPPSVSRPNTRSQQRGRLASNRPAANGTKTAAATSRSVSSPHKFGGSSVSRPTPMTAGSRTGGMARNRAMSAASTVGTTQKVASTPNPAQQALKKAALARRESFKPRPSVDGGVASSTNHNAPAGRYAQGTTGLSGLVVKEEET
jgi:hypothetical protein